MSAGVLAVGPNSDHMNFAASESAALEPCAWERWFADAEKLIGHDLDGDDSKAARDAGTSDGYSVDGAYDAWRAGFSVQQYADQVAHEKAHWGTVRLHDPIAAAAYAAVQS